MGNFIQKFTGFLAFLLVLSVNSGNAQTNVSGVISTNSTWSKINSPYKITGNVQVNSGITLTIEPGVQVVFQDNFYLKILGTINSVGTVGDSIIFKSSNSNNWAGILLINSTTTLNTDYSYASGSIFKYNSFKSSNKALFVYNSGFYIENCKFQDNLIGFEPRASSKGLLKSTTFLNNTTGIYTEYEDNTTGYGVSCIKDFKLQENLFELNTTGANLNMNQRTFDNLQVVNNIFSSNSTGLTLGGGGYGPYLANVLISNNNFTSNTNGLNISNIYSNGYNGCTGTLSFPLIIEKNLINNNSSIGLSFSYSGNNHTVRNNIILSNSIGISITGTTSSVSFQKNSLFENKKTISVNGSSGYEPSSLLFTTNTFKNSSVNSSDYIILNNVTNNNNKAIANNFIDISNNFLVKNINRGQFNLESNYVKLPSGVSSVNDLIYDINDDVSLGEVVITTPSNTLTTTAPLNPVHNVTKNLTGSGIVLTWSANTESDVSGYKIYYGGYTGYSYTNSVDVGNVTSTTVSAGIGIDENFAVTAYDASKDGTDDQYDGNESWYSTANKIPNAPTNLVAEFSGHKVKLNWDVSTSSGVNNYNIYRSTDGVSYTKLNSTTNSTYTNTGLTAYTKYYYKVASFDSLDLSYDNYGIESELSSAVNAIPTNRFYVDSAIGIDASGIGSIANPYKKVSVAVATSISGDTILVGKGTYLDNIILTKKLTIIAQNTQANTIIKPLLPNTQIFNFTGGSNDSKLSGFTLSGGGNVRGSAIDCNFSSPIIENCIITKSAGEAPIHFYYTDAIINNCLIYKNTANSVFFYDPNDKVPTINHSTIVYNTGIGTGSSNTSVIPVFTNCIIYGNSGGTFGGNISILNSLIEGDYPGNETNVNANPKFVDSLLNDYRLQDYSPAIGLGTVIPGINKDFDGNSKPLPSSSNPDAGAYENSYDHPAPYLTDSTNSTQIKISNYQFPTTGLSKIYIYKGLASNPTSKADSITIVNSYADTANKIFNKYLYYRFTSIGTGFNESGYSNEIKTILFTKPNLLLPTNKSNNNDTTIKFVWTKNENAIQYKLQYSIDSTFTNNVIQKDINDTSIILSNFKNNTNYYWRVLATDTIYRSPWSNVNKLQTFIAKPILDSIKSVKKNLYLYWTNKDTANTKYVKIYRDSIGVTDMLIDSIAGNQLSYIDSRKLVLNQKYYYRIKLGNYENIESDTSNMLNATPINTLPKAVKLSNKSIQNVGEYNFIKLSYSASGSIDTDGNITSYNWYVNDSLVNKTDSVLNYFFKIGTNSIKLIVIDNDGGKDSSTSVLNLSSLQKVFPSGILGGISAISPNYILTADTSFNNTTGSSVSILDRSGNTIFPIVVQSKIFTTPSISSDTSIFITNGSNLNGYSKSGVSLWPTIPLGGISYVTPTIDSNFNRIYVGVSNKNFFAYDYKTGKNIWSIICDAPINTSAVITGDKKLIFTSQAGTLYGFDISKSDIQTTPKWKMSFGDIITKSPAVDASSNIYVGTNAGRLIKFMLNTDGSVSVKWNVNIGSAIQTSPVIDADSNIYVGTEKGDFYKINRFNGSTIWSYNVGAAIFSTPNISEYGTIYVSNMNGLVTAITTDKRVLWKYQDIGPISANSLYINNMLYIASEKGSFTGIYDNPNSVNVNTSISSTDNSISSSLDNISTTKIINSSSTNISTSTNLITPRMPVWGTFQGDSRRTGSLSLICPTSLSISRAANGNLISNTPNYIQWYKDGSEILNATDSIFKPTLAGNYFIKNNQAGCNTVSSNSYYYLVTDIVNLNKEEFIKLTPNPFINFMNIDFVVKGHQRMNIEVFSASTGAKMAIRIGVTAGSRLVFNELSPGIYFVRIASPDMKISHQFKMVKL
jgi:hypothetical protein